MLKKAIKSYFMAIVAVMMVVGFSAFKVAEKSNADSDYIPWYFTGDDIDDVTDPSKYSSDPNDALLCNTGVEVICEIYAPEQGTSGEPDLEAPSDPEEEFSDSVELLILEAMDPNNIGTPNESVKSFRAL